MPQNIEIKATLKNRAFVEAAAARLSHHGPEIIQQRDFFFPCQRGRLKLRILAEKRGELIYYQRSDAAHVRSSHYQIARTSDPEVLLEILTQAVGEPKILVKERTLYLIGQTRLHLDRVVDLGEFIELEVVMEPGQSEDSGTAIANRLLSALEIDDDDFLGKAYIDLLQEK